MLAELGARVGARPHAKQYSPAFISGIVRLVDLLMIIAVGFGVYWAYVDPGFSFNSLYVTAIFLACLLGSTVFQWFGVYAPSHMFFRRFPIDRVLSAWAVPTTLDQRYAFHSESIDEGENFSSYRNPKVDALIEEMEVLPEIEQAEEILHEIQQLVHEDQPMTFLWESQRIIGYNHRLHDLNPNLLGTFWFLEHAWLEPPA